MHRFFFYTLLVLALPFTLFASADKTLDKTLHVQLKEAISYRSTVATTSGGVVWGDGLRIQAQNIQIEKKEATTHIKAWGNLLLFYQDKLIRGDYLQFDVEKKTGRVDNALIGLGLTYVGAKQLRLNAQGGLSARNAWISPYPSSFHKIALEIEKLRLNRKNFLFAQSISFRFFRIPLFYLPSGQTSLSTLFQDQFQFRFEVRSFKKSKAFLRWKFFTSSNFDAHLLASYFWGRGLGIGLELAHSSDFQLRAQLVRDASNGPQQRQYRWRSKAYFEKELSYQSQLSAGLDALSDHRFTKDFNFDAFDEKKSTQTFLRYNIRGEHGVCQFLVVEKLNSFQTVQRKLPSLYLALKPKSFYLMQIPLTYSICHESGYLQQNFSKQTSQSSYTSARHLSKASLSTHARVASLLCSARATAQLQLRSHMRDLDAITGSPIAASDREKWWLDQSLLLKAQKPLAITSTSKGHGVLLLGTSVHLQSSTQSSPDHHFLFDLDDCPSKLHHLKLNAHYRYFPHEIGKRYHLSWEIDSAWKSEPRRYRLLRERALHKACLSLHCSDSTYVTLDARADIGFEYLEHIKAQLKHTFSDRLAAVTSYLFRSDHYPLSCLEDSTLVQQYRDLSSHPSLTDSKHQLMTSFVYRHDEMTSWRSDHVVGFGTSEWQRYRRHGISVAKLLGRQWVMRLALFTGDEGHGFKVDLQLSAQPPVPGSTLP